MGYPQRVVEAVAASADPERLTDAHRHEVPRTANVAASTPAITSGSLAHITVGRRPPAVQFLERPRLDDPLLEPVVDRPRDVRLPTTLLALARWRHVGGHLLPLPGCVDVAVTEGSVHRENLAIGDVTLPEPA